MYLHFIICAFYCTCMHNIIFKKEGSSHFNFTCVHMHVNELKLNYFNYWKKLCDLSIFSKNKLLNVRKNLCVENCEKWVLQGYCQTTNNDFTIFWYDWLMHKRQKQQTELRRMFQSNNWFQHCGWRKFW